MSNNKVLYDGDQKDVRVSSGGTEGAVYRYSHREITEIDGLITATDLNEEYLPGFQGDTNIYSSDGILINQVGSTYEYYDYALWVPHVTKIEVDEHGDLHLTTCFRSDF